MELLYWRKKKRKTKNISVVLTIPLLSILISQTDKFPAAVTIQYPKKKPPYALAKLVTLSCCGKLEMEAAAARHLLSVAATKRLVWLGSNPSWRGGRYPCVWVKEKKRVAAGEIPSALQLLLGVLLSSHPNH